MAMHMDRAAPRKVQASIVVVFQSGRRQRRHRAVVLTKDDVIVSDELNHASIIEGAR